MATLKQLDIGRHNNFDLLRFLAATIVILSHSYLVTGNFKHEPLQSRVGFIDLGALGVKIFFAISGFLITKSMLKQPTLAAFVKARCLRIFPGLLVTAIFCAFVIGPLATTLPLSDYFANKQVYEFMLRLALVYNFGNELPGTFHGLPFPQSVNSPIWTLSGELLMYFGVLLADIIMALCKRRFKQLLTALPVIILVVIYFAGINYAPWYRGYLLSWGAVFLMGACCFLFAHKIVLSIPIWLGMLLICAVAFHFRMPYFEYLFDVVLVYGIMIFAYYPALIFTGFAKVGDCSYGLYIYAFPIQQLLVLKFPGIAVIPHFLLSFLLTMPLAWLSWHYVEKPLLKLKASR